MAREEDYFLSKILKIFFLSLGESSDRFYNIHTNWLVYQSIMFAQS